MEQLAREIKLLESLHVHMLYDYKWEKLPAKSIAREEVEYFRWRIRSLAEKLQKMVDEERCVPLTDPSEAISQ